jgi:uncharacterized protein
MRPTLTGSSSADQEKGAQIVTSRPTPQVRELDRRDINSILTRNFVGRLAYAWGDRIDIRPIHYVYADGVIYGRTSYGAKFEQLKEPLPAAAAFEVDEVDSIFEWRSVIVRGQFAILTPDGAGREAWGRATDALRKLVRQAFTDEDPLPHRTLVFQITPDEVTGRAMA